MVRCSLSVPGRFHGHVPPHPDRLHARRAALVPVRFPRRVRRAAACNALRPHRLSAAGQRHFIGLISPPRAGVAELADAVDSKSTVLTDLWVRPPPPAPGSRRQASVPERNHGHFGFRVVSDESEPVSARRGSSESGRAELTPLSESGVAVGLEDVPAVEVSILVEVIEDRGMNRGEPLQGLSSTEALHCALTTSQRLV